MAAFDFSSLQPDLIIDALQQLGLDVSSGLLALNSYENRVYQFSAYTQDSARPEKYVVKFYRPNRWNNAQLQEEHSFAFELGKADIPIVAPLVINGSSLHDFGGYSFAIYPSRGGRTLEIDNDDHLAMLGRFLGRMHQVGYSENFEHRPTLSIESHLIESRATIKETDFVPQYLQASFYSTLDNVIALCEKQYKPKQSLRLHGDCHAGNLFYIDEGPFFVDLDDCRQGPAIQDLWMMLSGDRHQQRDTLELMLEEYEQYCEFDPSELKLIEPLRAMRMVHYMAWVAKRWQDPAFPLNFPWFTTDKYWEQQCLVLKEQLFLLQQAPLSLVPDY